MEHKNTQHFSQKYLAIRVWFLFCLKNVHFRMCVPIEHIQWFIKSELALAFCIAIVFYKFLFIFNLTLDGNYCQLHYICSSLHYYCIFGWKWDTVNLHYNAFLKIVAQWAHIWTTWQLKLLKSNALFIVTLLQCNKLSGLKIA